MEGITIVSYVDYKQGYLEVSQCSTRDAFSNIIIYNCMTTYLNHARGMSINLNDDRFNSQEINCEH